MFYDQAHRLGPTLGWARQMSRASMDARVSRYDITPAQAHMLLYLHHHGGQASQGELTRFMRVRPSTANGVLDRMEEKGLVRRSVSGSDARKRLITLAEKGEEQHTLFQQSYLDVEGVMLKGFSQKETELLLHLLDRIIANLEEDQRQC